MEELFLTILMITIILIVLVDCLTSYSLNLYKKKANRFTLDITAYENLCSFLSQHNYDVGEKNILIEERKVCQYRIRDNSIGFPDFNSMQAFDMFGALHEGGHYISINRKEVYQRIYKYSQYIIGVNRLIVIPLFSLNIIAHLFGISNIVALPVYMCNLIFLYFVLASLLKLFIGLPEEIYASGYALEFIQKKYDSPLIKLAKITNLLAFMGQATLVLLAIVVVSVSFYLR